MIHIHLRLVMKVTLLWYFRVKVQQSAYQKSLMSLRQNSRGHCDVDSQPKTPKSPFQTHDGYCFPSTREESMVTGKYFVRVAGHANQGAQVQEGRSAGAVVSMLMIEAIE